jgi:uncharacterized lipoprotein YajG
MTKLLWASLVVAAVVSIGLAACSRFEDEQVQLASAPPVTATPLPGANQVNLSVSVTDRRAQPRDGIGIKSDINSARFRPANDIAAVVRDAVEGELKAEGFVLGPGGGLVAIDVQNFFFNSRINNLIEGGAANVTFTLRVRDATGATLYTRTYEGNVTLPYTFDAMGIRARKSLQQALADAIRQIANDKALQAALLSSARRRS